MKDRLDDYLLESGDILREGYSKLMENMGKAIAFITLAVATLITFTDICFCDVSAADFTSRLLLMLAASYVMFFSLEESGERRGAESEEYRKAMNAYRAVRERFRGDWVPALRSFLLRYSEEELAFRVDAALMEAGLSKEDLAAYRRGEKFPAAQRKKLRKIAKLKPVPLSAGMILSAEASGRQSELKNPESSRLFSLIAKLIPSTLSTLLTVSVVLTAKSGLDVSAVIDGLLKLSVLPIVGFRGYIEGYRYVKIKLSAWTDAKCAILGGFLKETEKDANNAVS